MNSALRLAASVVALLCLSFATHAQEPKQGDIGYPKCEWADGCDVFNLEYILKLQQSGGDIRAIPTDKLRLEIGADGRPKVDDGIRIDNGILIPPLLDEVVRIEFDVGLSQPALCTGVALNRDIVLTAGHCTCAAQTAYRIRFPRYSKKNLNFNRAVEPLESEFYDPRTLSRRPLPFFAFDCQRMMDPQPGHDLGLLFLEPSSLPLDEFNPVAPPAVSVFLPYELSRKGELRNLLIVGYGRREDNSFPHNLIAASTAVRDPFCLNDRFDPSRCAIFREFSLASLVTETDPGADTCDGDSGGPVYFIGSKLRPDGLTEFHRLLVGITSRGLGGVPQFGLGYCGGGGIYTAVGHPDVLKWLAVNGAPLELGLGASRFAEKAFREKSRLPSR